MIFLAPCVSSSSAAWLQMQPKDTEASARVNTGSGSSEVGKNKNTQQSDQNVSQGAFAPIFGQNKFNKNKKGAQTGQKRPNANPDDPSAPKKPKAKPKILTDIDIPR